MAKKTKSTSSAKPQRNKIENAIMREHERAMQNGLQDALGLGSGVLGFNPGSTGTAVSQVDTLFKNNRWYLVSNMRQLLSEVYVEHGLIQTIVDVPVDDAFRGGVKFKSDQLSEDQLEELETAMDRDNDLIHMAQAMKWNRLYGGAGVLIITGQDPELPLDLKSIKKDSPLEFKAVDMWELYSDRQNLEGDVFDPVMNDEKHEYYSYYGKKVHKSRVMPLKGFPAPSFIRPRLRGWGLSVVEALVRSINQYLKANNLSFEVLDEFKLDVFKLKNLVSTLFAPQGQAKVRQRVDTANRGKNYLNSIVLDSEDDYVQKQLSFSGLAETMAGIRMQIASDMRMPITKLFGTSTSSGMKTDQNDMENYNSMVESSIRQKAKYDVLRMAELKCQKIFGMVPDDLSAEFKPLRVLTAEEEENVKNAKFQRALQARSAGEITSEEFRDIVNRDDLLPITLDKAGLAEVEDEQDAEQEAEIQAGDEANDKKSQGDEKPKEEKKDDKPENKSNAEGKPSVQNTLEYEMAAYETDGGDSQFDSWRVRQYMSPGKVDQAKWKQAQEASMRAYGMINPKFVIWKYLRDGGQFNYTGSFNK